ncbi:MAG: hypothetical protein PQJ46_13930 [Spirochaetales bacterium]|nr:hypothetical protein [Spirochaetales bacterium]
MENQINVLVIILFSFAPVFTAFHWVFAPSHFGIGSGGLLFFIEWLTKYPNAWGINYQVLFGIICVLGYHLFIAIIPCNFENMTYKFAWLSIMLASLLYLPILIRLDFNSLIISFENLRSFPYGITIPFYRFISYSICLYYSINRIMVEKGFQSKK